MERIQGPVLFKLTPRCFRNRCLFSRNYCV